MTVHKHVGFLEAFVCLCVCICGNGNDAMCVFGIMYIYWHWNVAKLSTIILCSLDLRVSTGFETTISMRISFLAWFSSFHWIGITLLYWALFIRHYRLANHQIFIDFMREIWKSSLSSIIYKVYFGRMLDEAQRRRNHHKVRKATPYCILGGVLEWILSDAAFNSSMLDFQNQKIFLARSIDACVYCVYRWEIL